MDENKNPLPRSLPDDRKLNELVSAVADSQRKARERADAAEQAIRKKKDKNRRLPILLTLVAVATLVFIVTRLAAPRSAPVAPRDSARETIYVTALALNAEFEETGEFPEDLESIGMDEEGLTYTRGPEGYTLVMVEDGFRVQYSQGEDLTPFREAFEALAITGGGGGGGGG